MSEKTLKKKPDFSSLDFSAIKAEPAATVPAAVELPVVKKTLQKGLWINGISNEEVTAQEFKEWLSKIVPGTGVETWEDSIISTPEQRETVVVKLSRTLDKIFCFPQTNTKQYLN